MLMDTIEGDMKNTQPHPRASLLISECLVLNNVEAPNALVALAELYAAICCTMGMSPDQYKESLDVAYEVHKGMWKLKEKMK